MTKFERLATVIQGGRPDRLPASMWFHFGGQFLSPADQARYYLKAVIPQDWDLLKVMFEYRPAIAPLLDPNSPDDLTVLLETTDWEEPFRRQRQCLQILARELQANVPIIESGYSPWFSLLRWLGRDYEQALLADQDVVPQILEKITTLTCQHVESLKGLGIHGYFHATIAASTELYPEQDARQTQHDQQILLAGQDGHRFLHLHGNGIDISRASNYAFEVLNYADRHPSNPTLAQARVLASELSGDLSAMCLMGGICERTLTQVSSTELKRQIRQEIQTAGDHGLIISPGCTVSPSVSPGHCEAIRDVSNWRASN